jgi:hypothetical protein
MIRDEGKFTFLVRLISRLTVRVRSLDYLLDTDWFAPYNSAFLKINLLPP